MPPSPQGAALAHADKGAKPVTAGPTTRHTLPLQRRVDRDSRELLAETMEVAQTPGDRPQATRFDHDFSQIRAHADNGSANLRTQSERDRARNIHAIADRGVRGVGLKLPFLDVIQNSFGYHDVTSVEAHTGRAAAAAANEMGAVAFARGNHIAFGAMPSLHTTAHEAAHVVQQRAGVRLKDGVGETGDPYEQHADAVANLVAGGERAEPLPVQVVGTTVKSQVDASGPAALRTGNYPLQMNGEGKLPKGDKKRLIKLVAAAKATSLGRKFIADAKGEPKVVWGNTDSHKGSFDGNHTITLNESLESQKSDCEWQQVIVMELGNFAYSSSLNAVYDKGEEGNLGKEDFVNALLRIELQTRNLVIQAYESGEFGAGEPNCPCIFPGKILTVEDFIKDSRGAADRAKYEQQWEENCKEPYLKKHSTK